MKNKPTIKSQYKKLAAFALFLALSNAGLLQAEVEDCCKARLDPINQDNDNDSDPPPPSFQPSGGSNNNGGSGGPTNTAAPSATPPPPNGTTGGQTGQSTQTGTLNFVGGILSRTSQSRSGTKGGTSGGGASSDDTGLQYAWSPFVVFDISDLDREATAKGASYDQSGNSAIFGVDILESDSFIFGGTFSYFQSETDFKTVNSSVDNKSYVLGFHTSKTWNESETYLDSLITIGKIQLDTERTDAVAEYEGSPDGAFHSLEVAVGRYFNVRKWTVTPSLKVLHLRGAIDSYSESNLNQGGLVFGEQKFESLNTQLALQADYVILRDWGVLVPSIFYAVHHELADADAITTFGQFGSVTQKTDDPEETYSIARINLALQLRHGLSGFLSFESLLGHDYLDSNTLSLGFRYEM